MVTRIDTNLLRRQGSIPSTPNQTVSGTSSGQNILNLSQPAPLQILQRPVHNVTAPAAEQRYSAGNNTYSGATNAPRTGAQPDIPHALASAQGGSARNTPVDPSLTDPVQEFNPLFADAIRNHQTRIQQIIADRDALVARNEQDLRIGTEDIGRTRDRAQRANAASLASRGVFNSSGARQRESEIAGDFDRLLRDLAIAGTRRQDDILSGATQQVNLTTGDLNQILLERARDNLTARLLQQQQAASAVADRSVADRLNSILQQRLG